MKIHLLLVFTLLVGYSFAQQERECAAVRITTPPKMDGNLNEGIWLTGKWQGNFTQRQPIDNSAPSQPTYFKIFYTDNFIYVGIKALDSQADSIDSRLVRRDRQEGDMVGVHFDSYNDRRTSFSFFVNAAGVKSDVLYSNGGSNEDHDWNPIWWVKTTKDNKGWYAEMKIPLSQLRFSKKNNKVWGFEVSRYIYRLGEISLWQPIPRTASGWVFNFGRLNGIRDIKPKRIIEIAPYATLGFESFEKEEGNPYATGKNFIYGGGLDGKLGITNDFVLDFTINPDFGQVEADPSEVNLTAFETYFHEKRPFFVAGKNLLDFKITPGDHEGARDNLFYSRRIGRMPEYYPSLRPNEYVDYPLFTRILGAMKVTGKTKGGFSLGVMESLTREEKAPISYMGKERKLSIEPMTNYFATRIQQDFNGGNTIIGGAFTSTNRFINDSNLLFLPKEALSGGLDYTQYWKNHKYYFKVDAVASHIYGDSLAMIYRQTSPQRYFQRPDMDYVHLDSGITSMNGNGGNITLGKQVQSGFSFSVNTSWRSPGLSLNDIGYIRNADKITQSFDVGYNFTIPKLFYRSINIGLVQWNGWNYGGASIFNGGMAWFTMQFKNQYTLVMRSSADFNVHDDYKLRGGPSFYNPGSVSLRVNLETNTTKKFYMDFGFHQKWGQYNASRHNSWDAGMSYRPINALQIAFDPNFYTDRNEVQYVDQLLYGSTKRYILGTINQSTLMLRFRINLNLTPDLTIQYYAAPFISTAKYSQFKRVVEASSSDYYNRFHQFTNAEITYDENSDSYLVDENKDGVVDYSFGNPNFNFKQFQSNLVLRWEFTPGSVLYLVWTQNKTNYNGLGTFNFSEDMHSLFSTYPHNVVMLKFSYRFFNR